MHENMNWMKLIHLLSISPLNIRAPFCTSTFTSKTLIAFPDLHPREKTTPIHYVYYVCQCLKNTPSYTHVSLYVV